MDSWSSFRVTSQPLYLCKLSLQNRYQLQFTFDLQEKDFGERTCNPICHGFRYNYCSPTQELQRHPIIKMTNDFYV